MLRELTAAAVAVFALEVLVGILALNGGLSAWGSWLAFLSNPVGLLLNLVVMALLVFHAWSWFDIMPKTIPPIVVVGRRVPDAFVTRGGQILFALLTVMLVSVVCL
jgi:fumarate reductase subunit C